MNKKSVHCVGDGSVLAYLQGPDVIQLFGNDYSTPNFLTLRFADKNAETMQCKPKEGSCIFDYIWERETLFTDFAQGGAFVRLVESPRELRFQLQFEPWCEVAKFPGEENCLFCQVKMGAPIYTTFVTSKTYLCLVKVIGGSLEETGNGYTIRVKSGSVSFTFADAFREDMVLKDHRQILDLFAQAKQAWRSFSKRRKRRCNAVFDGAACQIKAQLSRQGAEIAGYAYHLAYIRDNFGTFMGLFPLGMQEEAQKLLDYFLAVFRTEGEVHNAQGMGCSVFHIHENDEVEITGYLGLMPYILAERLGKNQISPKYKPLVRWCVQCQLKHLRRGMLCFNGDETYIAGGIVPRTCINDGSLETTMLFHTLLKRITSANNFEPEFLALCQQAQQEIEKEFSRNFLKDGHLTCTNSEYARLGPTPRLRYGVQECGHGFGWSFRNRWGHYVCVDCIGSFDEPILQKEYHLPSIVLTQLLMGGTLIPEPVLRGHIETLAKEFLKKAAAGEKVVGYEPGLVLLAVRDDEKLFEPVKKRLMEYMGPYGTWAEYYENGEPCGTLNRAWESGINIYALAACGCTQIEL